MACCFSTSVRTERVEMADLRVLHLQTSEGKCHTVLGVIGVLFFVSGAVFFTAWEDICVVTPTSEPTSELTSEGPTTNPKPTSNLTSEGPTLEEPISEQSNARLLIGGHSGRGGSNGAQVSQPRKDGNDCLDREGNQCVEPNYCVKEIGVISKANESNGCKMCIIGCLFLGVYFNWLHDNIRRLFDVATLGQHVEEHVHSTLQNPPDSHSLGTMQLQELQALLIYLGLKMRDCVIIEDKLRLVNICNDVIHRRNEDAAVSMEIPTYDAMMQLPKKAKVNLAASLLYRSPNLKQYQNNPADLICVLGVLLEILTVLKEDGWLTVDNPDLQNHREGGIGLRTISNMSLSRDSMGRSSEILSA